MKYLDYHDVWPDEFGRISSDVPLRGEAFPHLKPQKRKRSPGTLKRFRLENAGEPCEVCESRTGTQVHHKVFRSRGGGDNRGNLQWVCRICHSAAHGVREVE